MAIAWTKRLYAGVGTERGLSSPVPGGKIWVIRCIDIVNVSAAGTTVQVGWAGGPWFFHAVMESTHLQWTGRQVLQAGETINLQASATVDWSITGYELDA
jgi:hypothetical protein